MLHSAVIEVRQHLCCANVFLKFKQSLSDSKSLKITVDETKVKLQIPTCTSEIFVNRYFLILPGTLSNLIADAENASFRFSIKDVQIFENDEINERGCVRINLAEKDDASVVCCNCESILVNQQRYDKIREFPSGAIDVSEFFCHHGPNYEDVLVPSTGDIFYGFLFIVLNRDAIEKNIREKENHIYCKRCLRYLGETMFNGKAIKLWCDSTRFNFNRQILDIFVSDDKTQIHKLILKAIDETSLPSTEPLLRNMHFTKVLLKAYFPNRQQHHLLLHILEKNLPVLRNFELSKSKMSLADECDQNAYDFKHTKAFKILYRLIAKDEDNNDNGTTNWPLILGNWQQNISILKMQISPFLFSALNNELTQNMNVLPEIYRVNNDNFFLSYIFY